MPGKPKSVSEPTAIEKKAVRDDTELQIAIASRELAPLEESPALNRLLLRHARKSYAEISAITGIPVGEVAERLTKLLDSRDYRDDLYEEKLLLAEMGMFMEDVRERMSRLYVDDESWASMARVQLAAIKTMLENLAARRKAVNGHLALLTHAQAKEFVTAIAMNNQHVIEAIRERYPDVEEEFLYAEYEESIPKVIDYLESRVDEE